MKAPAGSRKPREASPDEVRQAAESLTVADTAKLKSFAEFLAFGLMPYDRSVRPRDLIQEAISSALEDRRNWHPDSVDFVRFLMGAMRSIANNWKRKAMTGDKQPRFTAESIDSDRGQGQKQNLLETTEDQGLDPERILLTNELLSEIDGLFQGDSLAWLVVDGWKKGMKGPEIIEALGISKKEFETATKRIRRKINARWPRGRPNV